MHNETELVSEITTQVASQMTSYRAEQNMTQGDLATAITLAGYPSRQSLVSRTESGRREISLAEACALAQVLGVTLSELIIQ